MVEECFLLPPSASYIYIYIKSFFLPRGSLTLIEIFRFHVEIMLQPKKRERGGDHKATYATTLIFYVIYYLELRNAIIVYFVSHFIFNKPWSNWLFGHYRWSRTPSLMTRRRRLISGPGFEKARDVY